MQPEGQMWPSKHFLCVCFDLLLEMLLFYVDFIVKEH